MSGKIAFFDFDGTITHKDTLLEFIRFSKGTVSFMMGFLVCSPWIAAWKLGIISNQAAKEKVLWFFFNGTKQEIFETLSYSFATQHLPLLPRQKALEEILLLQQQGFITVIVSASPRNWIEPQAAQLNMQLIATELELKDGLITGKISGKNCHGEEKVRRIKQQYNLSTFDTIYAYGDSSGDKPMLALATKAFMKPFRS
jgi:phosphatidylglycerophosphatase C